MSLNLSKRITTSAILLCIIFVCLFFNKFLWFYLIVIASMISFYEFSNLLKKIYRTKRNKFYFFNVLSFLYLSFLIFTTYELYKISVLGLVFILLICIFSDTGGYVIGKTIGGKKLTKISPNKTISGSIGSFIFSLFPVLIFLIIHNSYELQNNVLFLIFISLFLSLICQIGDLFISFFKRKAKAKDTGKILPGHGGLLDRIDGFIFVLPVSFILIKLIY